ncbi:MAG: hypothetical protein ACOY4R_12465 [Pseudomonadota bacterium]
MDKAIDQRLSAEVPSRRDLALRLFPFFMTALSALMICLVFVGGVRRGMDHVVTFGPQSEQNGMAIAISELVYGLDAYVGYASVVDALVKKMNGGIGAGDPNYRTILPRLGNADLLNEAIGDAISLGPQPRGFVSDGSLMTMVYDDVGIVDFDKAAFSLFGFRIQSLYYLFFTILSLSTAVFLLQFWIRPVAHIVLLCCLYAFFLELHGTFFVPNMPTFWGMRHGSTLAIVPMWHIALLLAYRARPSPAALVLALVQVAILVMAIKIRGSAVWTIVFLLAVTSFFAFRVWRNIPPTQRSIVALAKLTARWPLAIVILGWLASGIYTNVKLHPAYFTDDILPYHGAWHSAYLGLATSTAFWKQTGVTADPQSDLRDYASRGVYRDRAGYERAIAYLQSRNFIRSEAEYISPWTRTYKMRLHDNVMRRVFLVTIGANPAATVGLYLFWKPLQAVLVLARLMSSIPYAIWALTLGGTAILAGAYAAVRGATTYEIGTALWLLPAAAPFAALPNMWAYATPHTVVDLAFLVLVFVAFAPWAMFVWLIALWRRHVAARAS